MKFQYCIFETAWGYFGLIADESGLVATILPTKVAKNTEKSIILSQKNANNCKFSYEKNLFLPLQDDIKAYFAGSKVKFPLSKLPVSKNYLAGFKGRVLRECSKIGYGKTLSYKELAEKAGNPAACRAVGNVLGANKLPLLIPCHRVIRSDGKIGGFSAIGGEDMKSDMLNLEAGVL